MLLKSKTNGQVDAKKVKTVLNEVVSASPQNLTAILRTYKKIVDRSLLQEEVTIELASPIKNEKKLESEIVAKTKAKRIRLKINPNIVFGSKITHGDWVWDNTLEAKLKQLTVTS